MSWHLKDYLGLATGIGGAALIPGVSSAIGGLFGGGSAAAAAAAAEGGIGVAGRAAAGAGGLFGTGISAGNALTGAGMLAGYMGQQNTNAANAQQAQNQMAFQEQMSNTSWQRGVKDMEAAGLNPMLAYSQGGASAPGGTMATMGNTAQSAMQTAAGAVQLQQGAAQTDNIRATTDKIRSETMDQLLNTAMLKANIKKAGIEALNTEEAIGGTRARSTSDRLLMEALARGGDNNNAYTAQADQYKLNTESTRLGMKQTEATSKFYDQMGPGANYIKLLLELLHGGTSAYSRTK